MKHDAPSSMITSMARSIVSGSAASRSTPKGFWRSRARTLRISSRIRSGPSEAMPRVPKPPASETAAQTRA